MSDVVSDELSHLEVVHVDKRRHILHRTDKCEPLLRFRRKASRKTPSVQRGRRFFKRVDVQ